MFPTARCIGEVAPALNSSLEETRYGHHLKSVTENIHSLPISRTRRDEVYSLEVRVTPFRALKEPITSSFNDFVKWTPTSKHEEKLIEIVYVKIAEASTEFFKILLENKKWLINTVH